MACLLFKPFNVILGKQNYVGPITLYCTHTHLKLNLILLLNFWSKLECLHAKHTRVQNSEQDGTVHSFQKVFTSGQVVNEMAVTSRSHLGEESEDISGNTSEAQARQPSCKLLTSCPQWSLAQQDLERTPGDRFETTHTLDSRWPWPSEDSNSYWPSLLHLISSGKNLKSQPI